MIKKKQFIVRRISGSIVLVPVGETTREFNGLITVNDVAGFIWDNLEKVTSSEELVSLILEAYDVSEDVARKDVLNFITELEKHGFIEKK